MSFSFLASGTGAEVIDQLNDYTDAALGNDRAGIELRDLIADVIGTGAADLEPHKVYLVRGSGHSSSDGPFTMTAAVELGDRLTPDKQVQDPGLGHAV